MKQFRKLRRNNDGSLSSYTMILFGMIVIMYLFGFSSMWSQYTNSEESGVSFIEGETDDIDTDPAYTETPSENLDFLNPLNMGFAVLNLMLNSIYTALIGVATLGGIIVLFVFFRNNQAIWQYVIPILLLVILNIFVFPISALQGDMAPMDAVFGNTVGFSFTLILIVFFNLFYLLAVLEFVRGGST